MLCLKKVEICAGCGAVSHRESGKFKCPKCGSDVAMVISEDVFRQMVKSGAFKAKDKEENE